MYDLPDLQGKRGRRGKHGAGDRSGKVAGEGKAKIEGLRHHEREG